jgi:uridine kinase
MGRFSPSPAQLADTLVALDARPARVAVDGIDCSGKTTLADLLAGEVAARGRPVIRAGVDSFLRSAAERYGLGEESPEGYARLSVDYEALRRLLLDPLGTGGSRSYGVGVRDPITDRPVSSALREAPEEAVLIVDGVFLQRPEVRDCWDAVLWVEVPFPEALRRALLRDAPRLGSREAVRARYLRRYLPGQLLYLEECSPRDAADLIVTTG